MSVKFKKIKVGELLSTLKSKFSGVGAKASLGALSEKDAQKTAEATQGIAELIKSHSGEIANNPYLQSRLLWQDMYGGAERHYRASRKLNQRLLILLGIAILGVIYIGAQSKYVPYVVQMQDGQVVYSGAAQSSNFNNLKPGIATYFIQEFIKSARSVSTDGFIEKNKQKRSYALTQGASTKELSDFFDSRDPFALAKKESISVQIHFVNKLPNNVFRVGWSEIARDSTSGSIVGTTNYTGEFTYKFAAPAQSQFILQNNPFGFYITNISWTGVK